MAPPSQLSIATNVVIRLLKEKTSYRRELQHQTEQISNLERDLASGKEFEEGNGEYMLRQLVRFPPPSSHFVLLADFI